MSRVCAQPKKSYICAVEEGQKRKSNKRDAPVLERSAHWIRETVAALSSVQAKAQSVQNSLRLVTLKASVEVPSSDEVRSKFADAELNAIRHFNVHPVPYPQRALREVFQMAVARGFTFEEKKDGVVGLQDCVILLLCLITSQWLPLLLDSFQMITFSFDSLIWLIPAPI